MLAGIAAGGITAYFAHRQVNNWVGKIRDFAARTGPKRRQIITTFFGSHPGSLHQALDEVTFEASERVRLLDKLAADRTQAAEVLGIDAAEHAETMGGADNLEAPTISLAGIDECRTALHKLIDKEEMGIFQKIASKLTEALSRSERANQFIERGSKDSQEKFSAAFMGGGIGGAIGYVVSSIWGIAKGSHEGNRGKRQFERAKSEIKHLRETNQDLEKINDQLHAKYVEASTKLDDVKTANESNLSMGSDAASIAEGVTAKPATTLNAANHQGMLAKTPELAVPEMA